ncbi:hypothetical protein [Algivirga pacifica]|uniref:Uncharacterized protein n=1 Tax=Algivirga pacifica TaxID=1162670 RepID=A0ABP9DG44_9BACT
MRIINEQVLPKELLLVIENDELEWDGGAIISSIEYFGDDAKIILSILLDRSEEAQSWAIQLKGVRNEYIQREWSEDIVVYDQHFLIDEQKDSITELYIKNRAKDPYKLLHDLYLHFLSKFNGCIAFDKYLNKSHDFEFLLQMTDGLFAQGPEFILKEINSILNQNGCETYFWGDRVSQRWSNNQCIDETSNLIVLCIGDSYYIAEEITFTRLNNDHKINPL